MRFSLVTPMKQMADFTVTYVGIPGEEGSFGVLEGHAPVLSTLKPGALVVKTTEGEQTYAVGYGFVDVGPDHVTVLAEEAFAKTEIDYRVEDKALQVALSELSVAQRSGAEKTDITRLERKVAVLQAKRDVADVPLI